MIIPRLSGERGYAEHGGWLKSRHSFSFANYYDPAHMNFSALRVINEDWIAAEGGFAPHPHKDMEILTYVLDGAIAHKDSMGNSETVPAGEFQIMSAGTGVVHSEFNPSQTDELHLFQIWIMPNVLGVAPRYEQKAFADKLGGTLILSPQAQDGSFMVYQDMKLWRYQLDETHSEQLTLDAERAYYLQVAKGSITVDGVEYHAGDALKLMDESMLDVSAAAAAEFLLFDLPR
ncbi:quercetin 2,3-dioxygenase [Moraxella caviae]|uniref:Quercetin 2,3-dioxygenase n=1 Tax=Moraxella caviae TaxID=34060 RepID=A0A1S9ZW25_9GAMM|nr:pirin family protein [Moraxella caviae]OOR87645.1 quercetin 2,3-dioxygenase [Moraxella caviae]STZ10104.1 Quercetin 2,3-dioxygenase [Moraxella caviae]